MPNKASILHQIPEVQKQEIPTEFPYPHYYDPHPLAIWAAEDLQRRLKTWKVKHDFGLKKRKTPEALGKMFGVLVVEHYGKLAYLSAFSGKIAGTNQHQGFVPPVFDVLEPNGFFRKGEEKLNALTAQINELSARPDIQLLHEELKKLESESKQDLFEQHQKNQRAKQLREQQRNILAQLPHEAQNEQLKVLSRESQQQHYELKDRKRQWKQKLEAVETRLHEKYAEINVLEERRKQQSAELQQQIFEHFNFMNAQGEEANLLNLFQNETMPQPPAGAGECAAPRLLQYAYQHNMKPITMAEFWWGMSPPDEMRRHGHYYPACKGKCGPILKHMLNGLTVTENPLLRIQKQEKLNILYEDEYLLAIDKPSGLLSVPGREINDSVQDRLRIQRTNEQWMPAHRLDMDTSGILLFASNQKVYEHLQKQFLTHKIVKHYVAILTAQIEPQSGSINLPIQPDYHNRPRQMVHPGGKQAMTRFEVLERKEKSTRVRFFPETGRTHQLRIHAAHPDGLDAPIKGDDLYGIKADRLYLHAERMEIEHPITHKRIVLRSTCPF